MRRRKTRWFLPVLLAVSGAGLVAVLVTRDDIALLLQRAALPEALPYQEVVATPVPTLLSSPFRQPTSSVSPAAAAVTLPAEINLAVPFTAQAPHGNWEAPYKEFCEEASVLMAASYLQNKDIPNADFAAAEMRKIQAFEEKRFGYYEDTTAEETATILREYYKITNVKLLEEPSAQEIRQALAAGKLVILPAAGRLLGNPYYTPPGPLYHMLVIKGYTAEGKFITNDPGTRRGADFLYSPATIMNAMHDWRADGNVTQGRAVVLIVG